MCDVGEEKKCRQRKERAKSENKEEMVMRLFPLVALACCVASSLVSTKRPDAARRVLLAIPAPEISITKYHNATK